MGLSCVAVWRGTWILWDAAYERFNSRGATATSEPVTSGLISHAVAVRVRSKRETERETKWETQKGIADGNVLRVLRKIKPADDCFFCFYFLKNKNKRAMLYLCLIYMRTVPPGRGSVRRGVSQLYPLASSRVFPSQRRGSAAERLLPRRRRHRGPHGVPSRRHVVVRPIRSTDEMRETYAAYRVILLRDPCLLSVGRVTHVRSRTL